MTDDTPPDREPNLWRARAIGLVALAAWFALLWFMFGDVL